jgi:hypothetical protein
MRTPETPPPPPYDVGAVHEGSYSCHLRLLVAFGQHIPGVLRVGQFAIAVRPTQARCNHHLFSGEISRVDGVETFCSLPDPELELCVLRARTNSCRRNAHIYMRCELVCFCEQLGFEVRLCCVELLFAFVESISDLLSAVERESESSIERSHVLFPIPDNAPSDHASRHT